MVVVGGGGGGGGVQFAYCVPGLDPGGELGTPLRDMLAVNSLNPLACKFLAAMKNVISLWQLKVRECGNLS